MIACLAGKGLDGGGACYIYAGHFPSVTERCIGKGKNGRVPTCRFGKEIDLEYASGASTKA